ncbi:hypothetical protein DSL64_15415 [Dyadobacter luteus]|uniref:Uncharacterized protein n=1 Tax=Dyadobacter luteus TaxID=2259619 RepID=A0A3D8YAF4_9BACT|nr:hypothetical protein DSL64_15415 [Dyadobacter luteus]
MYATPRRVLANYNIPLVIIYLKFCRFVSRMNWIWKFLWTLLNIIVFVAVRHFSLLSMFLLGMGAADHYKYESFGYLPGTAIQLVILLILSIK